MLKFGALFGVLLCCAACSNAAWHQVWSDEFNVTGFPSNNEWEYEIGGGGWGNNEIEYYTSQEKNVRQVDGHLVIEAQVENYKDHHFTSGRLTSRKGWAYGRFEARARLPSGHHLWPALWLFPLNNTYGGWAASGEIDILELKGDKPNEIMGTIHYGGSWPNNVFHGSGEKKYAHDFSKDFHIFALEWDHNEMRWYMDSDHFHTENINKSLWSGKGTNPYTKNGQPFDIPFRWVLNLAVGGQFVGGWGPYVTPEEAKLWPKKTLEVDYVRVYEWK